MLASGVEYRFVAVSILKLGDVAAMGPLTEIVYVPAVAAELKSSAYTFGKLALQLPRFSPIGPENTVIPLAFFTANVAPVSEADAMR